MESAGLKLAGQWPKLPLGMVGLTLPAAILVGLPPTIVVILIVLGIVGEIILEAIRWLGACKLERERRRADVLRAQRQCRCAETAAQLTVPFGPPQRNDDQRVHHSRAPEDRCDC